MMTTFAARCTTRPCQSPAMTALTLNQPCSLKLHSALVDSPSQEAVHNGATHANPSVCAPLWLILRFRK